MLVVFKLRQPEHVSAALFRNRAKPLVLLNVGDEEPY